MPPTRKSRSVTLSDVAKDAGVSPMTVSRVINGETNVREETRARVRASIERLNYAPNISARNLAGAKSLRICLLYGNPSSAYLGELLMGVLEAAREIGAHVVVERTHADELNLDDLAAQMNRDWDAMIVPAPISDNPGIWRLVEEHRFPAIFLSSAIKPGLAAEINIDEYAAAHDLTAMLISQGHRRIAFIKGHPDHTAASGRFDGYKAALREAGISLDERLVRQGYFTYRSGLDAADQLLGLDEPPTAIFAANDDMAAGVLASAARHGLSVPRDLSVAGFDNSPIATTVWPNLTTVRQPVADMAALAVKLAARAVRGRLEDGQVDTIRFDYEIIERDSVARPPR